MNLGLRGKVIVVWIVSQVAMLSVVGYFSFHRAHDLIEQELLDHLKTRMRLVAAQVSAGEITLDQAQQLIADHPNVLRARVETEYGPDPWRRMPRVSDTLPVTIHEIGEGEGLLHLLGHIFWASIPIGNGDTRLVAVYGTAKVNAAFARISETSIWALLCFSMVTALGAFWTDRTLRRHIGSLTRASETISHGDTGAQVEIHTRDPLENLAESFNHMSMRLAEKESELIALNRTLEQRVDERTLQLRKTQEELVRAEKVAAIGKMAAGLAHELRNPISGVRYAVEILTDRRVDAAKRTELRRLTMKGLDRVERLVSALLKLARQEVLGSEPLKCEIVELRGLIEEAGREAGVWDQIKFQAESEQDGKAFADKDAVVQILSNLFRNSAEASPGGTIRVSFGRCGEAFRICVEDDGPGVPDTERERIFDAFYTTKATGSGLGLAVARHLARSQGGDLRIEECGGRACFSLTLPASSR